MERAWNHHQPLKGQKLRTIFLVKSNVGRSTRKTQLRVTIQMKAIEQYFHVVLFTMLHKVVLTFKSVDETLVCDYSNESY